MHKRGCIAFIPARGGSKRLPRKNVMNLQGRPMISWTINAAIQADCFDEIYVSTDDDEIAAVASLDGATPLIRPDPLAGDDASVTQVLVDYLGQQTSMPETVVVLYATAPMRSAEDILATRNLLEPGKCDFAVAVSRYQFPPHQALKLESDDFASPVWPDLVTKRTSELGDLVVDNGSTYAVHSLAFLEHRTFFGPGTRVHAMPFTRSIDIDEPSDFEMMKLMMGGR
ncbi:MAG: pseudaminic acid cytidylyltransferase [Rhodobacteraceae bacterium]|nr:pseudaminic acid cytidylyltransferase [Paracoccaceae bacterium]